MSESSRKKILVTGGGGYIGSHTVVELWQRGYTPVILENWSNSSPAVLDRISEVAGEKTEHHSVDLRDASAVQDALQDISPHAVIHFAGLKAVGESNELPLDYYENNVVGTLNLLRAMQAVQCKKIVFSSSATVYGDPETVPIKEDAKLDPSNPYGRTKLMIEHILQDLAASDPQWQCSLLRYFNPVGAHPSGRIGEDPSGIPNNLMPFIAQVAVGRRERLSVFGGDYPTPDGTGVRDYIHVVDLAAAHLSALRLLDADVEGRHGCRAYNIGTGNGYSVLEMVKAFEKACQAEIPYSIEARRQGDIATCYADPALASQALGWVASLSLEDMVVDHWRWQKNNPQGYGSKS